MHAITAGSSARFLKLRSDSDSVLLHKNGFEFIGSFTVDRILMFFGANTDMLEDKLLTWQGARTKATKF